MPDFHFHGEISSSKSIFNRALIIQSYFPELELRGFSECDDVRYMRTALRQMRNQTQTQTPIDCGEGGTTLRFLALRASRIPGEHILGGSQRLMQRPHQGLLDLLLQLGVQAQLHDDRLIIRGDGWKPPQKSLLVDTNESSQYASSLALNSWLLDFPLEFELVGKKVSESYFLLTLEILKQLGMPVNKSDGRFQIPSLQKIDQSSWAVEADLSSSFTVAAAGALAGSTRIVHFPFHSLQPDLAFLKIFEEMDIVLKSDPTELQVTHRFPLKAVNCNLSQSPDLFPVLAVLCSWAEGVSTLYGAPHLTKKESNRIMKVSELLSLAGVKHEIKPDGMVIYGNPKQTLISNIKFNPDKDHRMVMAAVLMNVKGHQIQIEEPQVINKSFPEFWEIFGAYK